jgi:hypothetical protein
MMHYKCQLVQAMQAATCNSQPLAVPFQQRARWRDERIAQQSFSQSFAHAINAMGVTTTLPANKWGLPASILIKNMRPSTCAACRHTHCFQTNNHLRHAQDDHWATQPRRQKNHHQRHVGVTHRQMPQTTTHIEPHTIHLACPNTMPSKISGTAIARADNDCRRWRCHHDIKIVLRCGFVVPRTCTTSVSREAERCWLSYQTWQTKHGRTDRCSQGQPVQLRSPLNPNNASETLPHAENSDTTAHHKQNEFEKPWKGGR